MTHRGRPPLVRPQTRENHVGNWIGGGGRRPSIAASTTRDVSRGAAAAEWRGRRAEERGDGDDAGGLIAPGRSSIASDLGRAFSATLGVASSNNLRHVRQDRTGRSAVFALLLTVGLKFLAVLLAAVDATKERDFLLRFRKSDKPTKKRGKLRGVRSFGLERRRLWFCPRCHSFISA